MKVFDNETMNTVGIVAKKGCKLLAQGLIGALSYVSVKDLLEMIVKDNNASYSDAVDAIMSSNIYSDDKKEMISALRTDGDSEFYKAVISIVNGGMYSSSKVECVKDMCKKEE